MAFIKLTAKSTFHGNLEQSFRVPAAAGTYYRRCQLACDDKRVNGIQVHCGCGWPVMMTEWIVPDGWRVEAYWTDGWMNAGRNNIMLNVSEEEA